MSVSIANVNSSTETFSNWLDKTNQILDKLSTVVVTTAANTAGGLTSGNASISGIFSANVISVGQSLRGGTVESAANLAITSNVAFSGANVGGSVANFQLVSSNVFINSVATSIVGGSLNITSNVNFQSNTLSVTTAGRIGVNTGSPDATLSVIGTANISGNALFSGLVNLLANVNIQANTTLTLSSVPNSGYLFFGNTGSRSLAYDGTKYVFAVANVQVQDTLIANAVIVNGAFTSNSVTSNSVISNSATFTTPLPIASGGTGSNTAAGARTNLSLGSLATLSSITSTQFAATTTLLILDSAGSTLKTIRSPSS